MCCTNIIGVDVKKEPKVVQFVGTYHLKGHTPATRPTGAKQFHRIKNVTYYHTSVSNKHPNHI